MLGRINGVNRKASTLGRAVSVSDSAIVGVFLFAMFEGGGNVPLITPVVAAMVERGHDVAVVAGPNIRRPAVPLPSDRFYDRLRATGARIVPLLDEPIDPLDGYAPGAAIFGRTPASLFGASTSGAPRGGRDRGRSGVAAAIAERRPQVLVCDFFLLGALAAGESAGVPTAALGPQQQHELAVAEAAASAAWVVADAWPGGSVARPSMGGHLQPRRPTRGPAVHQRCPRPSRAASSAASRTSRWSAPTVSS